MSFRECALRHAQGKAFRLREFFYQLLRVDLIRYLVAVVRYFWFVKILRRLKEFDSSSGDIGVNTVHHNKLRLGSFKKLIVNRSNLLLYPLAAIRLSRSVPILCVGPRTEGEILNYRGLGFRNIQGVDLISYSPWIDLGDMHALPYEDDAFAVTISSFCLAYSNHKKKAAQEILRVTKHGGIIGVGDEFSSVPAEEVTKKTGYQMPADKKLETAEEVLALFGQHIDHVYFCQDRPLKVPEKYDLAVLFAIKK